MPKKELNPADYISPLYINGLQGRMLNMPSSRHNKKREILLLYGVHSSIERMFGLVEELCKYGNVTLPDMPGMGGMDSLYKIGQKPDLDTMADYLAAFVKMRYSRRRVTILGFSLGFVVATRMLQKHPELAKKVDLVISIVGFTHYQEFKFKRSSYLLMRYTSSILSNRFMAWVVRTFFLRGPFIYLVYTLVADRHSKFKDADKKERNRRIAFEIILWKINDIRTYMDLGITMLTVNLCNSRVKLPVYHVAVDSDQYFDNYVVEQHMGVIYSEVHVVKTKLGAHMPTVVASAKEVAPFIPAKIRSLLASSS
jgi:pimeloyl-ACP methyl ester carboxylesterase